MAGETADEPYAVGTASEAAELGEPYAAGPADELPEAPATADSALVVAYGKDCTGETSAELAWEYAAGEAVGELYVAGTASEAADLGEPSDAGPAGKVSEAPVSEGAALVVLYTEDWTGETSAELAGEDGTEPVSGAIGAEDWPMLREDDPSP